MKKKIIYAVFLILVLFTAPACEKTCKTCKKVYYIGTTYDGEEAASQYCGADLLSVQAKIPITIGGRTAKWECN